MASVPTCLVHAISIQPSDTFSYENHLVYGQESVCFEEAVEITKEDGNRQELDV